MDFSGLLGDIEEAPENSVIVLHMTAHNPTGCDLTQEQWVQVADVMEVCVAYHSVARQTHNTSEIERRTKLCSMST